MRDFHEIARQAIARDAARSPAERGAIARADMQHRAEIALSARTANLAAARPAVNAVDWRIVATGAGLRATFALDAVRTWMRGVQGVLVILGPLGAGKTIAIADALARAGGRYATMVSVRRMFASRGARRPWADLVATGLVAVDAIESDESPIACAALAELLTLRPRARTIIAARIDAAGWEKFADTRLAALVAARGTVVNVGART